MSDKIYPIGIQNFEKLRKEGYFYIDKTALIYKMVKTGSYYFLSRPRRFGKSLLVSTLKNYFLGRKELFKGLKIDTLEKDWKVYPVFHLDFNGTDFTLPGELERKLGYYISSWADQYALPEKSRNLGLGDFFAEVIRAAHQHTGRRAVVLIDEYDKPILDVLDADASLEERNRNTRKRNAS